MMWYFSVDPGQVPPRFGDALRDAEQVCAHRCKGGRRPPFDHVLIFKVSDGLGYGTESDDAAQIASPDLPSIPLDDADIESLVRLWAW
jgi:hypothetical protein